MPTEEDVPVIVAYLGLDRTGIKRPDKAIHRLISKVALHPKKISGRLCFDREELGRVLANGDHKRGRGRSLAHQFFLIMSLFPVRVDVYLMDVQVTGNGTHNGQVIYEI